jgi:Peptidase family M23
MATADDRAVRSPRSQLGSRTLEAVAVAALLAVLALLGAARATAATRDHFTPLTAEVLAKPEPVLAADGRRHLAYELILINHSFPAATLRIRSIETIARSGTRSRVVGRLAGKSLTEVIRPFSGERPPLLLSPGQSASVQMDASFPRGTKLPRHLVHRIEVTTYPPSEIDATTYLAAPTAVGRREPLVVAPPLRGPGWVVGNGCCREPTSHRSSVIAINGGLYAGERFAIDFFQLDAERRLADGPPEELSSYPYYGDEVLSATAGRVVAVVDRLPDVGISLSLPPITAADAGGNHVVVKLGPRRYAFYAHLIPGSVRVHVGDRVRVGETLGLLGNSGNSNAPHLHFQLMDGPIPLGSNGIPFRFSRFRGEGVLGNFLQVFALGSRGRLAPRLRGERRAALPLNDQVIDFG